MGLKFPRKPLQSLALLKKYGFFLEGHGHSLIFIDGLWSQFTQPEPSNAVKGCGSSAA